MDTEQAKALWYERIYNHENDVDPSCGELWGSIALGFFIGLGFSPEEARDLRLQVKQ